MPEKASGPAQTMFPHIHNNDSISKRYWGQTALLALSVLVFSFLRGWELLRVLLLCLVNMMAFEFLSAKLFSRKEKLYQGGPVMLAFLLAILMPEGCSPEMVVLACFLTVFIGWAPWGGMGAYLFHPVLLARVFLQAIFPRNFGEPMILTGGVGLAVALGISGLILLKQKQLYWEIPVFYIAVCFLCAALLGLKMDPFVFLNGVFLAAFFLLADPVTLPLTRRGVRVFAFGTALSAMLLSPGGFCIASAGLSVLLMNLLTPWLDVILRPVPYKTKTGIQKAELS